MPRALLALIVMLSLVSTAYCQGVTNAVGATSPGEKQFLAFQMLDWQTKHFNDANQASEHAKVLKQLQCEVKTAQHNGHTDVSSRTIVWKSLALDSQDQVRQWRAWLDAAGFETIHGYKPTAGKLASSETGKPKEIVKYRLADWKSQHAHQSPQLSQFLAIYRAFGCETEELDHGNHKDLRIRCPQWMEVEFPSHTAAHKWQDFLNKAGFETAHEH